MHFDTLSSSHLLKCLLLCPELLHIPLYCTKIQIIWYNCDIIVSSYNFYPDVKCNLLSKIYSFRMYYIFLLQYFLGTQVLISYEICEFVITNHKTKIKIYLEKVTFHENIHWFCLKFVYMDKESKAPCFWY